MAGRPRGRISGFLSLKAEPFGDAIPVRIQRNKQAKRLILRADTARGEAVVTCPTWVSKAEALDFATNQSTWIAQQIAQAPKPRPFAAGATIPFLGQDHMIRHRPTARGGVWWEDGEIHVTGRIEHLPRRVEGWLKREARRQIAPRVAIAAEQFRVKPGRIVIRDTRTRWGSCAWDGTLSFCWRLVLAPEDVLNYVVVHEVAHLAEYNHSPKFWRLVDRLVDDVPRHREWLNENGPALHMIGTAP
ncbi:MAG: SprT family zinc-dependent metalloprotease [Rhodospirillaceae bacterium]